MGYEIKEGQYNIDGYTKLCSLKKELTKASIIELSKRDEVKNLQIWLPSSYDNKGLFSPKIWKLMDKHLFKKGKKFRLFNSSSYEEFSLDFLEYLPSLTHLQLDVGCKKMLGYENLNQLKQLDEFIYSNIFETDLNFLENVSSKITYLSIGETKKTLSLKPIEKFTELESLSLSGKKKNLESIQHLKKMNYLGLGRFKLDDLSFLKKNKKLKELSLALGSISDIESIASLNLSELELFQVRNIENLEFVKNYKNLKKLTAESQSHITYFPNLSNLSKLKTIDLRQLKNLQDFKEVEFIPNLKKFEITQFAHDPDLLIPVLKNKSLKELGFGAGTDKALNKMKELKKKYGKV